MLKVCVVMLKPHTQPHGACTCRADERSLRERAPLQAPGQLCWCLFATRVRAGEGEGRERQGV
jgi:hypothetical protein